VKTLSRDAQLGIGIMLALLIIITFAATRQQAEQAYPKLSTISAAPDGALALKLWVQELNYPVQEQVLESFSPPEDAAILFALEPFFVDGAELKSVDQWVENGGTLIVIGEQYGAYSLIDHYDFSFEFLTENDAPPAATTPLLNSPALGDLTHAKARVALATERDDYVVLAAHTGKPILVSFEQGKGRVILGTIPDVFTNAGLKQAGNPELVLNLLALARTKGTIWFDEWHHGLQGGAQILGPDQFLRRTPLGHALLFALFAVFMTLFLQGRGFGRPVPLPQEIKRRGAWEHVTGVANLSRRAAHRSAVMLHYHGQIKRKLGQRYRLDPGMDDELYVHTLAGYHLTFNKDELLNLLKRLKRRNISETEMVQLAVESAKWIDT
jgi:hypothetical protein